MKEKEIKIYEQAKKISSVPVMIGHEEVLKVVLNDLIPKRNACRDTNVLKCFDTILRTYYLTPEEFEIYVTRREKI